MHFENWSTQGSKRDEAHKEDGHLYFRRAWMPAGMRNSRKVELLPRCGVVSRSRGRTRSLSRNLEGRDYEVGVRLSLTGT